jgi:hypothetical protein
VERGIVGSETGFKGRLDFASPIELGQFLYLGRKTGTLHLKRNAENASIAFLQGRAVSAVGPDLSTGAEAAKRVLQWTFGEFQFVAENVADSGEIGDGTENLLLDAARLMDERGGERVVAAALKAGDELGRTFAAITAGRGGRRESGVVNAGAWIVGAPGRCVYQFAGHPLMGVGSDGEEITLDESPQPNPGSFLGTQLESPPFDGWIHHRGKRLYLSWGEEGYRLLHPFPRPVLSDHLADPAILERIAAPMPAVSVYGPRGSGKSLLAALVAVRHAERGARVLYLSGPPTHDLADGKRLIHAVVAGRGDGPALRAMISRWRPEILIIDVDPFEGLPALLRDARAAGMQIVLSVRAAEPQGAREAIRMLTRENASWHFFSPWPVSPGPTLEISAEAA